MNEERLNTNFDINAKYDDMIQTSKEIIDRYNQTHNGGCETPSYICLAYDVKNYLPNLQQENEQLKEQRDKTSKYLCQLLQEAYLKESSNIDIGLIEYAVDLLKGEDNNDKSNI